ncbi:MAG: NAD(P)H-quinone oxidoreductase [Woeseia sp.]
MKAIHIRQSGSADELQLINLDKPEPRDGEVLIRVAAAGVNRPDVLQRLGKYAIPPDADPRPGLEVAGIVDSCGPGVTAWQPGAKVMALTHGGGYAEYCRAPAAHCLPIPDKLSMAEAAAIPETFFTVWYNLFMRAALRAGETLLVHGGSSGIGTTAIQLARAFGAQVICTVGSNAKSDFCKELGAHAVNYRDTDWAAAVRDHAGSKGVNVVLDMVAGSYAQKNLDLLARDGRYVLIAFLQGSNVTLDLRRILTERLTLTGSTLRPQTIAEKAGIATSLQEHVLPLIAAGTVRPIVYRTFALAEAADAHRLMESSTHMGKIVLLTGH